MRFEGFESRRIRTQGADIFLVAGGNGPPVLLLHGYPENHAMWHSIAPRLAENFHVVAPELRGYGDSIGPPADVEHINYSKRVIRIGGRGRKRGRVFWRAAHSRSVRSSL